QGDAIVENSINNLRIYPNPATTQLSIDYGDYIIKDVKIYDVTGRCIKQEEVNLNRISIDVSDLHRGIYFLKINTEKGSLTRKVHIIR
ncbi:MAG TPA: T9SS type A sorting domain-containing protein, partial [Bacteroidales bacterium]|nr:T9SS type A sorting domain-containing protein [Bacteroidales bacterium]